MTKDWETPNPVIRAFRFVSTFVLRHFREIHLSFVIFPSIFRAPNDSEHLSTCPAPAGLISERGRKDR
ncbi:MAG: hypothetical protein DMF35_01365 [Verrucomicrobia bacterium]|nr:MAG: hypothetical protein DMF35_01365 [Verrucomicrobiota bacterium]PYL93216.1 MAG: hypothetical protein DME28_09585 [Verrucomicrobiota bacterium]